MTTESEASDVQGSLSLSSDGEEFTVLEPGSRVCLGVWGNVEANAEGELTLTIDKASVMPPEDYADEEVPAENPAAVAIRKDTVKAPGRPPVSVVDVMVRRKR